MAELEFMDSSGLRTLLLSANRFETAGLPWAVALRKESPVRRLLTLSGVEARLPVFSSREEAVGSLSSGG
jgi:anti-anti-sigma factor